MKKTLMAILACPVCKGQLQLTIISENADEIVSRSLFCPKCRVNYPITDTIPNLLPPEKSLSRK